MKNPSLLFWPVLILFYLATRLVNLLIVPIFTDEAIYTYWAQVALNDPANRFISLEDGKQPLFIWLAAVFQKFIQDPLIASRLVSVAAGLGSTLGIFLLAKTLFGERAAKIASILYVILPFTLLYDRMALFDSLLTMLGIYSVLLTIKLVTFPKLENSLLLGISTGFAMITKSSGTFFLYLIPASVLLHQSWPKLKFNLKEVARWLGLITLAAAIAQIIYNSLRLSPLFYIIARKNSEFIRPAAEVLSNPFMYLASNVSALTSWTATYMGIPLFIIFIAATTYGLLKRNIKIFYLTILIALPFGAEALFNQVLYPRFILFYFPYVILITAFGISEALERLQRYRQSLSANKKYLIVAVAVAFIIPAVNSFYLLTSPTKAKIADSDAGQYLNDWPSGYGVAEVVTFLKNQPKDQQVYIGTEGTFGLLPYALQIYFYSQQNIHIIGFWPVNHNDLPVQILDLAKNNPTYFVFNESQANITNPHLKLIDKYQKGVGDSYMRFYEVIP